MRDNEVLLWTFAGLYVTVMLLAALLFLRGGRK